MIARVRSLGNRVDRLEPELALEVLLTREFAHYLRYVRLSLISFALFYLFSNWYTNANFAVVGRITALGSTAAALMAFIGIWAFYRAYRSSLQADRIEQTVQRLAHEFRHRPTRVKARDIDVELVQQAANVLAVVYRRYNAANDAARLAADLAREREATARRGKANAIRNGRA